MPEKRGDSTRAPPAPPFSNAGSDLLESARFARAFSAYIGPKLAHASAISWRTSLLRQDPEHAASNCSTRGRRELMSARRMVTMDGNEAAASVAHRLSEVIAIYPITPSSNMGEWADEWSAQGQEEHLGHGPARHRDAVRGRRRRRGPRRAAGRRADDDLHGVAGPAADDPEHVQDRRRADAVRACTSRARALATHALSIFGDHSDVMAVPPDRLRAALPRRQRAGGARLRR